MFFLAQGNKELAEVLGSKKSSATILKDYNRIVENLSESIALHIHQGAPPDFESEPKTYLSFNTAVDWAKNDWKAIINRLDSDENWLICFVARGGLILLDEVENDIDDFIWTFIKPKVNPKQHESSDLFEEYTDPEMENKLEGFSGQEINILFIEDVVEEDEYDANIVIAMEELASKLEEFDITIAETACLALITRTAQIASIPVYGVLVSFSSGIERDWGNDHPDGLDYFDFSEHLETVVDHDS